MRNALISGVVVMVAAAALTAQMPQQLPMSPRGTAATQVGGTWVEEKPGEGPRYREGKWIVIDYGRPILRGRTDIFGKGPDYGKQVSAGAPIWRAGANETTRLRTEVPLVFGGKTIPAGEYNLFVELKEGSWVLILTNQPVQAKYDPNNKTELFGAYNYDPKYEIVRAPMRVETLPFSIDQFGIGFVNMTQQGGSIGMWWDTTQAMVDFKVGS